MSMTGFSHNHTVMHIYAVYVETNKSDNNCKMCFYLKRQKHKKYNIQYTEHLQNVKNTFTKHVPKLR